MTEEEKKLTNLEGLNELKDEDGADKSDDKKEEGADKETSEMIEVSKKDLAGKDAKITELIKSQKEIKEELSKFKEKEKQKELETMSSKDREEALKKENEALKTKSKWDSHCVETPELKLFNDLAYKSKEEDIDGLATTLTSLFDTFKEQAINDVRKENQEKLPKEQPENNDKSPQTNKAIKQLSI